MRVHLKIARRYISFKKSCKRKKLLKKQKNISPLHIEMERKCVAGLFLPSNKPPSATFQL